MINISKKNVKFIPTIVLVIFMLILVYLQIQIVKYKWNETTLDLKLFGYTVEFIKVFFVLYILNNLQSQEYKLIWILIVVFFPLSGLILYAIFGNPKISKTFQSKVEEEDSQIYDIIKYDKNLYNTIKENDYNKYNQAKYLKATTGATLYINNKVKYYSDGFMYYKDILKDISNAKKYIFIEMYHVSHGELYNRIIDALKQKKNDGIDIYVIIDSLTNARKNPKFTKIELDKLGIKCTIFNDSVRKINSYINYRDHRKLVVIDGSTSYTGGLNIGDEYTNEYPKFGKLKDAGIRISGNPVMSHVLSFVKMWNLSENKNKLDYNKFYSYKQNEKNNNKGYIVPYFEEPNNSSNPAKNLYIKLISSAKKYVYITTPYLVLDNEIINVLINSAKSGVDVRIVLPFISNKAVLQIISRSFYNTLLDAGVRLYEYKPGFIHSKTVVIDDEVATVGTANFDFRGLHFHYECGVWMYDTGIEKDIKKDFELIIGECIEIKIESWSKRSSINKFIDKLLITVAPIF